MVDFSFLKKITGKKKDKKYSGELKYPKHVVSLDKEDFDSFIEKYPTSMIDFWAPWCKPCKKMYPRIRELSTKFRGKIAFGRLNIQKNKEIADRYKIKGIPYVIIFRYGNKIDYFTGVKSIGFMKKKMEKIL